MALRKSYAKAGVGVGLCNPDGAEHTTGMPNTDPDPTVMETLTPGVSITYTEPGDGPSTRLGNPDEMLTHTWTITGDPMVDGADWWVPVYVGDRSKTVYVSRHNIVSARPIKSRGTGE